MHRKMSLFTPNLKVPTNQIHSFFFNFTILNKMSFTKVVYGCTSSGLFWTSSIVWYVKDNRPQRFRDWICLCPQTMDEVQNKPEEVHYTPSSESFQVYLYMAV
jgi:hypothetical protein